MTTLEAKKAIRARYAWPGGYEIYFVLSDGETLCTDCARREWRQIAYSMHHHLSDGWRIERLSTTDWDEDIVTCCHCNRTIYDPEG